MEFNVYKNFDDLNDNYGSYYKLFSSDDNHEPFNKETWNEKTIFFEMHELELFGDILAEIKEFDDFGFIVYSVDDNNIFLDKLEKRKIEINNLEMDYFNPNKYYKNGMDNYYKSINDFIIEKKDDIIKFFDDIILWVKKNKHKEIKFLGL